MKSIPFNDFPLVVILKLIYIIRDHIQNQIFSMHENYDEIIYYGWDVECINVSVNFCHAHYTILVVFSTFQAQVQRPIGMIRNMNLALLFAA